MSPVCSMNAGATGSALILSIAAFKRADNIGIRRLVESHVAVADLDEAKLALAFMASEREAAQA